MIQPEYKCDAAVAAKCSASVGAWKKSLIGLATVLIAFVLSAYLNLGRVGIEKVLTGFTLPLGFGWLLLTHYVMFSWFSGFSILSRLTCSSVWMLMTFSSTAPLPNLLMKQLESQVAGVFDPDGDQPLDVLIVFGGGTQMGPDRAEVTEAGDRVVYASELYLQGKAKRLITTGDGGWEPTQQIWQKLNIPSESIVTVPGANTFQEIQNIQPLLQQDQLARTGILSSAYHLPRIQRLAEKSGIIGLIPVAAHHRSRQVDLSVTDFVPSAQNLVRFSDALKEYLGRIVGR